jgi:dienelactone hydrolase
LREKRRYNAAIKLANHGYIAHVVVTYQRVNGQADERYNRTWISGQSWNEFKGKLTEKGVLLAQKLLS